MRTNSSMKNNEREQWGTKLKNKINHENEKRKQQ